jgi:hypothetical protein
MYMLLKLCGAEYAGEKFGDHFECVRSITGNGMSLRLADPDITE